MPAQSNLPVILVTGASRGIGLHCAQVLLHHGQSASAIVRKCNIVTLSRSLPDELKTLQREHEDNVECVQGDIMDEKAHETAVQKALNRWGRLDGLVLNAGLIEFGRIGDQKPSLVASQINGNLTSLFTTLYYALPSLRASPTGLGRVVLVSSGAAVGNYAAWAPYNASKAGLNAFARTLANEEGDKVAVWSIRPGVVDTAMQAQIRDHGERLGMDGAALTKFRDLHREGKLVKPEDPAHVLAALVVNGTLQEPKTSDGKGAGDDGAFMSWDEETLKDFRRR